jgi:hypothetical protein
MEIEIIECSICHSAASLETTDRGDELVTCNGTCSEEET